MDWTLAILFGAASLLLILSLLKIRQSSKLEQQEIEKNYFSIIEEMNQLQDQIRKIELDGEITAKEAGLQEITSKERILLREVLDLYKRGYSIQSIGAKKKMNESEVEQLLSPYISSKDERRNVGHVS